MSLRLGLPVTAVVLAADQASKWWILDILRLPEIVNLPLVGLGSAGLDLTMVWNRGVTFGLLAGDNPWHHLVLAVLAIGIAAFLLRWMARAETWPVAVALGAVVGGAVGNVIDRVRFGAVVDFIDVHVAGWHWYVFNIADAAIVCGVIVLVADSVLRPAPKPQPDAPPGP